MAHLWIREESTHWRVFPLNPAATIAVSVMPPREVEAPAEGVVLLRAGVAAPGAWVMIADRSHEIRINGLFLPTGIRRLFDRDEIRVDRMAPMFFSTEELAAITEFPGAERKIFCPRCKQEIARGDAAVKCPSVHCGVWYHQSPELSCWTYSDKCALCGQATSLEAGYAWCPGEI